MSYFKRICIYILIIRIVYFLHQQLLLFLFLKFNEESLKIFDVLQIYYLNTANLLLEHFHAYATPDLSVSQVKIVA